MTKNLSFDAVLLDNKKCIEEFDPDRSGLLLASQQVNTHTDTDLVEQFFCGEHGKLWMKISSYN